MAGLGQPSDWQLGLQQSATPVMDYIIWFHDFLLYWITAITAFVLALLIIVIVRFNARANPAPSRTTHNTLIEVLWTVVPILILMVDRGALVQAVVPPAQTCPAGRHHGEGHRQAVVLELQLSGPRQVRVRIP